jgi:hypothetical protein
VPLQSRPYLPEPVNLNHPLARGLVAWWIAPPSLDRGNKVWDIVGQNHGAFNPSVTWTTGSRDSCLTFDGVSGYVDCGNASVLSFGSGDCSIGFWFKTTTSTRSTIVSKYLNPPDVGWLADVLSGGQLHFVITGPTTNNYNYFDTTASFNDGVWHHFVGVVKSLVTSIYVDGKQAAGTNFTGGTVGNYNNSVDVTFGRHNGAGSSYFAGSLDSTIIYNRALSAADVFDLYNSSRLGYPGLLNQTKKTFLFFSKT